MPSDDRALLLSMSADIRGLERAMQRAGVLVNSTSTNVERRTRQMAENVGRNFERLSSAAGVAFGGIIAYSVRAAANAAETANAFQVAMGAQSAAAERFARTYSQQVGRSLYSVEAQMSQVQLVLTGVGQTADVALRNTQRITERAIDLGSLWNVDEAEAFRAIISGINGEAEPMRRFGVAMNEAAVNAELLRMGLHATQRDATSAQVAQARLNFILRQTTSAMGDATNTAGSLANQTRRMQAQFHDTSVEFGQRFLPVANQVVGWANSALTAFNSLPAGAQAAGMAMLLLVAAGGPIAQLIRGYQALATAAVAARAAMAGAAATTPLGFAAAGAGAASATGVGMVVVGAPLIAASATEARAFQSARRNPRAASDADLAGAISYGRSWRQTDQSASSANISRQIATDTARLVAEQSRRQAASAAAANITALQSQLADTTRMAEQLGQANAAAAASTRRTRGSGSGSRRTRASGTAEPPGLLQPTPIEVLDDSTIVNLNRPFDTNEIQQIDISGVRDAAGEFVDALNDQHERLVRQWADTIQGGLDAAIHGGWQGLAEYMAQTLERALVESLSRSLANLLAPNATGGGGIGGLLGGLFQFGTRLLTGGKPALAGISDLGAVGSHEFGHNAGGSNFWRGGPTWINDGGGKEIIDLPRGSRVIPAGLSAAMARVASAGLRGGEARLQMTINLEGANGDATIRRIAYQAAAEGAQRTLALARRQAPTWVGQRQTEGR